jgi:hypothetical protein
VDYKALLEHGFENRVKTLRAGLVSQLPAGQTFTTSYGSLAVADVLKNIDVYLKLGKDADQAEVALKEARLALLAATQNMYVLSEHVRSLLRGYLGVAHPNLVAFGIPPKKRRKLKSQEVATAGVRRGETRKIRGTLGPKQRLKLRAPRREIVFAAVRPPKDPPKDPEGDE